MTIANLDELSPATRAAEVVVIGAGIAGLILATRLSSRGHRVIVLESGGARQDSEVHPLNEVEQVGSEAYHGASMGRARCLGGTSTRWGGALLPVMPGDVSFTQSGWDADWLDIYPELMAHLPSAEALFDLPTTPYEDPLLQGVGSSSEPDFIPRLPKWPSFGRRNVAQLLTPQLQSLAGPEVILHATVTDFHFSDNGALASLTARSPNGASVTVTAPHFVLAAGAIESTRLLLLADRAADNRIFAPHDVLGRYFHDHISIDIADLHVPRLTAFNRHFGFRFEGKGMRSLRFEASEALRRAHDLPAALAQITFTSEVPGGFEAVRQMLRRLQRRELPTVGDLRDAALSAPWITRAAWWRYRHKRLLYPNHGKFRINVITEQMPRRDNRITLATTVDPFGQPLARLDWSVSQRDRESLIKVARLFVGAWEQSPYRSLATIKPLDGQAVDQSFESAGGTAHPGGTTRIGRSASQGVLDRDLRAFGIPNLTVTATSAFPNAGAANPTLMLVLATLRAADRLDGELRR